MPELRKGYVLCRRRKPIGFILKMSNELDVALPKGARALGT
jgi:hypothetical protein